MSQGTTFRCCVNNASTLTLNSTSSDIYPQLAQEFKEYGIKIPKFKKFKNNENKPDRPAVTFSRQIFGVPLVDLEWVSQSGFLLPRFLCEATTYLSNYIKVEIGLFRKAGSVARQRRLREKLESGGSFDGSEPNDVASLLKQWLRELPEPLIPSYLHDTFIKSISLPSEADCLSAILLGCLLLPSEHLFTLKSLLRFLAGIASYSEVNKMGPYNLALIMVPNLFTSVREKPDRSSGGTVKLYTKLIELLIEHHERVGEMPDKLKSHRELKLTESSDDVCDGNSVAVTKKQRGAVSDVVNSIKKLVGGGLSANGSCTEQPNGSSAVQKTPSRFANKRKAEPDLHISHIKKMAISQTRSACPGTPCKNQTTPSSTPSQNRRRSFGILKRRNRTKKTDSGTANALNDHAYQPTDGSTPNSVMVEEVPKKFLTVPEMFYVDPAIQTSDGDGKVVATPPVDNPTSRNSSPRDRLPLSNQLKQNSKSLLKSKTETTPSPSPKGNALGSPKLVTKKLDPIPSVQAIKSNFRRTGSIRRSSRRRPKINTSMCEKNLANAQRIKRTASHNRSFRRAALSAKVSNLSLPNNSENGDLPLGSPCLAVKMEEMSPMSELFASQESVFKRNYKSSLKRGRPNTIKTGLKSMKSSNSDDGAVQDLAVEENAASSNEQSKDNESIEPNENNDLKPCSPAIETNDAKTMEPEESRMESSSSRRCSLVNNEQVEVKNDVQNEDITWHLASDYINNELLLPKETCKRDSIVQILTNNAGKVHANVQHFNCIGKPFIEVPGVQTPFKSPYTPRGGKCGSETRSATKMAKYRKSPLPLPPKFSVMDINSPSPLKELTNLNNSVDNLKVSPGVTAIKRKFPANEKKNRDNGKHIPKKCVKAQRSESSPARPFHRKPSLARGLSENIQPKQKMHSYSFNAKDNRSDILGTSTSWRSIDKNVIEDE